MHNSILHWFIKPFEYTLRIGRLGSYFACLPFTDGDSINTQKAPESCETEAAFKPLIPYSLAQIFDIRRQIVAYMLYNKT